MIIQKIKNWLKKRQQTMKNRPGVSIIIALFMVAAFMLQMAAMSQQITTSLELHRNRTTGQQAYWNARSALELGLYAQTHPTATINKTGEISWEVANISDNPKITNEFTYNNDDNFSVFPFPGTGTVGGEYCNVEKMPQTKDLKFNQDMFYFLKGTPGTFDTANIPDDIQTFTGNLDILDHPCLWNKLESGKPPVSIPLYVKNSACEGGICNPSDVGLEEVIVRIRMPCKNGEEICEDDGRWKLATFSKENSSYGKRIVLWDITGKCENEFCYLTDTEDTEKVEDIEISTLNGQKINSDNLNKLVFSAQKGFDLKIYEFILSFIKGNISKPTLHLSISANLLADDTKTSLSNLEYQILYKQQKSEINGQNLKSFIADPTILATGKFKGFETHLETSMSRPTGSFGYAVISN